MPEFLPLSLIILLFSVILHEVMHGLVAKYFGDRTAEYAGRLTLNPISHIDPIGTILIPGLLLLTGSGMLFGWAKPVPVNPLNFSNLRRGELFVSAAGVLANFGLAIIAAILFHFLNTIPNTPAIVLESLVYATRINLILGVFNLFPIPPLDGSKVLLSQLPYHLAKEYEKLERYGFFIIIILMTTGILGSILSLLVGILSKILLF